MSGRSSGLLIADAMLGHAAARPDGAVDNIGRIGPFRARFDAVAQEMRLASTRFWMSWLRRSASLRTSCTNACSLGSPRSAGASLSTVAAPARSMPVARTMADRPDQRLAQLIGLRAHLGLVDGVRDAEGARGVAVIGQRRVDAGCAIRRSFLSEPRPKLIAITPELGRLRRYRAHQPDLAIVGGPR